MIQKVLLAFFLVIINIPTIQRGLFLCVSNELPKVRGHQGHNRSKVVRVTVCHKYGPFLKFTLALDNDYLSKVPE